MNRLQTTFTAAYRLLLRLHPAPFRRKFGAEMLHVFDELAADGRRQGSRAMLALGLRECGGLARSAVRAHGAELVAGLQMPYAWVYLMLNFAALLCFAMLSGFYLLFDYLAAISLNATVIVVVMLIGAGFGALAYFADRRKRYIVITLLFVVLVAAAPFINWNSRKPFLRALYSIQPGMTLAQADSAMSGFMRNPAAAGTTNPSQSVSYRHTNEGWGNSDIGYITFERGAVARVEFIPD